MQFQSVDEDTRSPTQEQNQSKPVVKAGMKPRALGSPTSSSVPQNSVSGFKGCWFSFELCPRKDQGSSQWGGTSSSKVLAMPKCWKTLQSLWSSRLPFARENYNCTMGILQSHRPKTMPQPCLEEILQIRHLQNFQFDLIYNYCYYYYFLKRQHLTLA